MADTAHAAAAHPAAAHPAIAAAVVARTAERLVAAHGESHAARIGRGVAQVAARWWPEDGGDDDFAAFCAASFEPDAAVLALSFGRLEQVMEQVDGHLHEVRRELLAPIEIDRGPGAQPTTVDPLLVRLDLAPHVDEDLFRARIAFFALLNFPVHTLRDRLVESAGWDRTAWARSRMMDRFASRVPAAVAQAVTRAGTTAEEYVIGYNIRMDRLVTPDGERPFPEGLRLISHWGLRDELRARYADYPGDRPDQSNRPDQRHQDAAVKRQRLILAVMNRIVRQEIPAAVIDNPDLLWEPVANTVRPVGEAAGEAAREGDAGLEAREADRRYAHMLALFHAQRLVDPYTPTAPSLPARRFEIDRQIPEEEVETLLRMVLEAPEIDALARRIGQRVGRPLEPFDIWYPGFKARSGRSEEDLDARVRAAFPTAADFQTALPRILDCLGFPAERASWLAERIVVDRARGAGHALGAIRREDRAHLRTRIAGEGMDYQGYNVAMHELGHNVEQVFSLHGIDHWWLGGVPNNAFTEAFAFLFQERDVEILERLEQAAAPEGRSGPAGGLDPANRLEGGAAADHASPTLAMLWNTYEIAGVSLVDMGAWRWLYAHPEATPAELREAILRIAREVWDRWFAPRLGHPGCEILAVYSHMIAYCLYLPDYALGHIVAFQLLAALRRVEASSPAGGLGAEIERIARLGHLTPDAWMRGAVGAPLSARPLLDEARLALSEI
jgi:hypothetical protein